MIDPYSYGNDFIICIYLHTMPFVFNKMAFLNTCFFSGNYVTDIDAILFLSGLIYLIYQIKIQIF